MRIFIALVAFVIAAPAWAVDLDKRVTFDIPAQALNSALIEFARQADVQVMSSAQQVGPQRSGGVSGEYTVRSALDKLLRGTGLQYRAAGDGTIMVTAQSVTLQGEAAKPATTTLAQADRTVPASAQDSSEKLEEISISIPEILVTGSRSLNMDIKRSRDDIQPYTVFDREVIEKSGALNIEDFLRRRLTSADNSASNAQRLGGSTTSLIDLRGLGSQQTLILIDGHRVASQNSSGSAGQPDLNGIPLAAVERIEVLPTTASGIYGGSATGGVVNVVLRRDYSGVETKVSYQNSFDGGGAIRRIDVAAGFNLEGGKTNILLAGSYSDGTNLVNRDRDFLRRARARTLENNPDAFFGSAFSAPLAATTNIAGFDPNTGALVPLTLKDGTALNSPFTFVSPGYAGQASDAGAQFVQNAGSYNFDAADTVQFPNGGKTSLLSNPVVKSATATLRRQFTPWLDAFLTASGSKNSGTFAANYVSGSFTVPAGAPANPFNETVQVITPAFGTDRTTTAPYEDKRLVGGFIFKLPHSWQGEADYTWNRNRYSATDISVLLNQGADAAVADGTLDVFRDTNVFPVDFAPYLTDRPAITSPTHTTMKDAALRLSGPLPFMLPGGAPTLSLLAERREENFDDFTITSEFFGQVFVQTAYAREQTIKSMYLESHLPVISPANGIAAIRRLEVQLAARRDDYSVNGANQTFSIPGALDPEPPVRVTRNTASIDPTIGFSYQPIADITFRASYGTGFLPPDMNQLVPGQDIPGDGVSAQLTDPLRGGEVLGSFVTSTGGSPDLDPERSSTRSAGVIFTPSRIPALRLSLDWTRIQKHDNVSSFGSTQETIDNEAYLPDVVVRAPAQNDGFSVGPIVGFNSRFVNVARQRVEAYDLAADYSLETSHGAFRFAASATRNMHNVRQIIPTLPQLEVTGLAQALKWQASTRIEWEFRQWGVDWATRFYDSYWVRSDHEVDLSQGSDTISTDIYHDVSARYRFDSAGRMGWLANSEIQFGIKNVFNHKPPLVVTAAPYYSTFGDPRLASYFLSLRVAL